MMTAVVISSGDAPGSRSDTLTVAGSALGNRSTPRSRNEKMPRTTSDMTSIVANTGRRTQSSENMTLLLAGLVGLARADGHLHAVDQLLDFRRRDRLAGFDAAEHFDPVAQPVAGLQFAE